jgi:hypothetical protein
MERDFGWGRGHTNGSLIAWGNESLKLGEGAGWYQDVFLANHAVCSVNVAQRQSIGVGCHQADRPIGGSQQDSGKEGSGVVI